MSAQQHSFGGSHMDRHIFEFEVDELAVAESFTGEETPEVEATVDPALEPAAAEPEVPAAEPSAEPAAVAWTADSPEFRQAVAEAASAEADALLQARLPQYLEQMLGGQERPEQPGLDPSDIDIFADDGIPRLIEALGQTFDSKLARVEQFIQSQQQQAEQASYQEGEGQMKDILTDLASREGEFNVDAAFAFRQPFLNEAVAKYGVSMHAAEVGLAHAARFFRGLEKAAGDKAVEQYKNEMATLAGAPSEASGSGVGVTAVGDVADEMELAERWGA